ncbi:MAG TPA: helix-turn-helix transcriptional regulator [Armatimonadota bacterium]|jgi:AraC-like DNA-binding protein
MLDDFCIWVEKVLLWVDREGTPPIPWIGQAGGRLDNPPAPHLEFIYTLHGRLDAVRIGERHVSLPPGYLSLHNVHGGNQSPLPREAHRVWCCFLDVGGAPEFATLRHESLFACVPVLDGARLAQAFEQLQSCCVVALGPQGGYITGAYAYDLQRAERLTMAQRMAIKSACLNLLAVMLREGEQQLDDATRLPEAVRRAMAFLSLHARDAELRLADVAAHVGLSIDHFGRLFRAALRMSPMYWLQAIRVEHSRFLLRHTRLTISEIAGEVGFNDPYYFSRVFRRVTGGSPRDFRRGMGGE